MLAHSKKKSITETTSRRVFQTILELYSWNRLALTVCYRPFFFCLKCCSKIALANCSAHGYSPERWMLMMLLDVHVVRPGNISLIPAWY